MAAWHPADDAACFFKYLYGKSRQEGSLTPELSKCIHDNLDE